MPGEFRSKVEAHERIVYEELRGLAEPHVAASNGLFKLLEINPGEYPAQSLIVGKIDGKPQDVGIVDLVAKGIEPRFGVFTDKLDALEEDHGEISRLGEHLRNKQNLILVTPHGDIKDIAYALAAYYEKLKEGKYSFHSSLVMSKILGFIGVVSGEQGEHADPAVNILKNICDEQYFSFPRTPSIEKSKIAKPIVDGYNKFVRKAMTRRLSRGRNLFAMAPSGATDKPDPDDPDIIIMGEVGPGTGSLMMTNNSLVVPAAMWIDTEGVMFEPCGVPRAVNTMEEVHDVMDDIAAAQTEHVPGKRFIYRRPPRNLGGVVRRNS